MKDFHKSLKRPKAIFQWKLLGTLVLILMFSTACDPARRITLVNQSEAQVRIRFSRLHWTQGDSLEYSIAPGRRQTQFLGLGRWSAGDVDSLYKDMLDITIHEANDSVVYTKDNGLEHHVSIKRKGLLNEVLKITIQE